MGSAIFRNRYWWYKSLYDDYTGRQMRLAFGLCGVLWLPHYWWGIHINRSMEENNAHKVYFNEFGPRRNRLTHSLCFEEFEMILEKWKVIEEEYKDKGEAMIDKKNVMREERDYLD